MSHCPSCGRYVGPHEACPCCGARLTGRISIRAVKAVAVSIATIGLAVLWLVATRTEVPTIAISQAGASMNLAYVRVEGRCTDIPSYDSESNTLSFWIEDGSDRLRIVSYRDETETLIEEEHLPALGDWIAVAGTLRVRDDFRTLVLNAPEALSIARSEPESCPIGALSADQAYRRVRVRGQVREVAEPYPGLTLITLRDETGSVDVALSDDLVALSRVTATVSAGQGIEVVGAVSPYKGRAQLVPASAEDISALHGGVPIGDRVSVIELSRMSPGQWVDVRGRVTGVDSFAGGVKMGLDDGSGAVTVLVWDGVYQKLKAQLRSPRDLAPGAQVAVRGELAEYRGELEVVPELPADVRVLVGADALAAAEVVHRSVATPGPVQMPQASAIPQQEAAPLPTDGPAVAATPTEGPGATAAVAPGPGPTATSPGTVTPIRSITGDQIGRELTVEGTVVEVTSFSAGFKLTLDDGQGRIVLLMWHDVYDDCWDRSQINLGALVRAQGEVTQYEGTLQIEPGAGADVKVIQSAKAQAPLREIGSISGADEGQRVMIEGEVVRTEGLPGAVKVFLRNDEGGSVGEIVVFVWRNVLDRVADNRGLGTPGSRVRVVGQVQVYRSNLELVPALPNDVMVVNIP